MAEKRKKKTGRTKKRNQAKNISPWKSRITSALNIIGLLIIVSVIGLGLFDAGRFMLTSDFFVITKTEIEGNKKISEDELLQNASV